MRAVLLATAAVLIASPALAINNHNNQGTMSAQPGSAVLGQSSDHNGIGIANPSQQYDGSFEGTQDQYYDGQISNHSRSDFDGYAASAAMPDFSDRGECSGDEGSAQAGGQGYFFGFSFGSGETYDCEVRNNIGAVHDLVRSGLLSVDEARFLVLNALPTLKGFDVYEDDAETPPRYGYDRYGNRYSSGNFGVGSTDK